MTPNDSRTNLNQEDEKSSTGPLRNNEKVAFNLSIHDLDKTLRGNVTLGETSLNPIGGDKSTVANNTTLTGTEFLTVNLNASLEKPDTKKNASIKDSGDKN